MREVKNHFNPNPNIISQLVKLGMSGPEGKQQLQQYYTSPPPWMTPSEARLYVPLAAERLARLEQAANKIAAPQTTVVEDMVAGLGSIPAEQAPVAQQAKEQTEGGVSDLPVPDTMFQEQSMAGGGIVAFDEGGYVPRYAGPTDGSFVRLPSQLDPNYTQVIEGYKAAVPGLLAKARTGKQLEPNELRILQFLKEEGKLPFSASAFFTAESQIPASVQAKFPTPASEKQSPDFDGIANLVSDLPSASGATKRTPPAASTISAAPSLSKSIADQYPEVAGPNITPLETETARRALLDVQDKYGREAVLADLAKRREAAGIKDIYGSQLSELEKEREGLKGKKDEAIGYALLEAGLGMMSGTSPYALQNIGAGAMRGVTSLKDAQKELRQNERELRREANALQRDQQNMLEARMRGEDEAVERGQARIERREDKLDRLNEQNTDLTNKVELAKYGQRAEQAKTIFTETQANRRAQDQINATLKAAQISSEGALYRALLGMQPTAKDRAEIQKNMYDAYSKYSMTTDSPISFDQFQRRFMATIGGDSGGYASSGTLTGGPEGSFVYTPAK